MIAHGGDRPAGLAPAPDRAGGSAAGKRYSDADAGLEVLCTKAGAGSLALSGRPLATAEAKKLPSSD